jgi:RNA recognition motif-containing protein
LRVQRLLNSTVWITNFPPTFTQVDLEKTFSTVGQVISVRLPSLKFNVQRRFCYIEFADSASAAAAVEKFDGEVINGFKLNVKISDPSSKQNRSGAAEEGREVYVSKLDFYKVTAAKVKELFGKYGIVQNVHLPLSESNKMQGKKHDGYGFVVFSTPAEAQNALSLNLISFEGRAIEVSISKKKSQKEKNKEKTAFKDYRYADNVLALKNLPDTINGDQLKSFFTKYGEVDDVVLEPRFRGALIILSNANEAGSISMKIEGKKIGDYNIELTTVSDLQRSEQPNGSNVSNATKKTSFIPSSLRRKPKVSSIQSNQPVTASGAHSSSPEPVNQIQKTNDDFRAMLLGKK